MASHQNYNNNCDLDSNVSATTSNISKTQNDQFKATKMWNEVLHAFYVGIKLGKHRRQMKWHYDCFTASDAITWLKDYLRNHERFNANNKKVTRFQALNLLRKYHKSNIIERVNLNKNNNELKDNNELYRFTAEANESLPLLNSGSKSQDDLLKCSGLYEQIAPVELDIREKMDIYKQAIWSHLNRLLYNVSDYIKLDHIDGSTLFNNVTKINSNGVVQLTDKSEDLPHWILSAMKCLANWPRATGSGNCLPKYPGFENDVFKLIEEYFTNMDEPIIPYRFYGILIDVHDSYVKAELSRQRRLTKQQMHPVSPNNFHISQELGIPANCVYETVFSGKEPVTKIVPIEEASNVFPNLVEYFKQITMNETAASLNSHIATFTPTNTEPANISHTFRALSTIPRNSSKWKRSLMNTSTTPTSFNTQQQSTFESPAEDGEYMSRKNLQHSSKLQRFYSLRKNHHKTMSSGNENEPNVGHMQQQHQYYQLIQLILLLLPNCNRRHLQLLIRMFSKIIANKELCLLTNDAFQLKQHIVATFTRCIIRSQNEKHFNEYGSREFVTFLIDHCMDVFKAPESYQIQIDQMMAELLTKKKNELIEKNGLNAVISNNDYCQKISKQEYELQRDALSDVALSDLLQSIMDDESLSQRDKLKWIKQFKMYHPDAYDVYFTNNNVNCGNDENTNPNVNQACQQQQHRQPFYSLSTSTIKLKRGMFKRFLSLKL